jgi:hypothetical protein
MVGGLVTALPVWAVYAPIPEQDQGKDWTFTVRAGVSHDSNIFGTQSGAISSMVYEFAPKIAFNASLTDQTFASAAYGLIVDHFDNRPGEKTLDSHDLSARLAHSFSPVTTLDVSDGYLISRNPESLLVGTVLNTDQSFKRNEFDAKFDTSVAPQFGTGAKFQSINYRYDDASLADSLDRTENLFGLSLSYDLVPEMKAVGEIRRQDILYRTSGGNKDKHSDFLIGGLDYAVGKQLTASGRLGYEWRRRDGEANANTPYVELSLKYDYAEHSFFSAGYVYTFEETSNVVLYTDTKVNRFFFNVQHALSALVVGSAAVTYEPSQLQGRSGLPNVDETTTRFGLALTYLASKNWQLTASYDYDNINSDDPTRSQNRERAGVSGSYAF